MITALLLFEVKPDITQLHDHVKDMQFYTWLCVHECFNIMVKLGSEYYF